ncbi:MAG: DnaJ domain-containing protein [Vulcanimicrobiota bacterium]
MQKRDHYLVLNVKPISTADEIRKAYRELSKKYHPDLNPGKKAASDDKMKELVAAYSVLNDKGKRKEYDNQPVFQLRRFAKGREKPKKGDWSKKKPQKQSFLKKMMSFFAKGEAGKSGPDPKQADVHFMLGLSMSETEQFLPQAKEEFKKALEYDKSHMEATYNLAVTCYRIGEFDEARFGLQDVLKLNANDQHAKHLLRMLHEPDL